MNMQVVRHSLSRKPFFSSTRRLAMLWGERRHECITKHFKAPGHGDAHGLGHDAVPGKGRAHPIAEVDELRARRRMLESVSPPTGVLATLDVEVDEEGVVDTALASSRVPLQAAQMNSLRQVGLAPARLEGLAKSPATAP